MAYRLIAITPTIPVGWIDLFRIIRIQLDRVQKIRFLRKITIPYLQTDHLAFAPDGWKSFEYLVPGVGVSWGFTCFGRLSWLLSVWGPLLGECRRSYVFFFFAPTAIQAYKIDLSLPPTRQDLIQGQKPEGQLKWG